MSADDFDIRSMVQRLRRISLAADSVEYPFGPPSDRNNKRIAGGRSTPFIPRGESPNSAWILAADRPIPGLHSSFQRSAYGALLLRPSLMIKTATPTFDELRKIDSQFDSTLYYERYAVATVVQPEDPSALAVAEVSGQPVAGAGFATFAIDGKYPVRSFADVLWTETTDKFARRLTSIWIEAGRPKLTGLRSAIAVCQSWGAFDRSEANLVVDFAALCGIDIKIFGPELIGQAERRARNSRPTFLIVDERCWKASAKLRQDFYSGERILGRLNRFHGDEDDELGSLLAEIRSTADLGAGLVATHRWATETTPLALRPMKGGVTFFSRRFGHFVEEEPDLFVSWDIDHHGESVFKQHKKTAKGLEWFSDLDENRRPIPEKHKGPIGRLIEFGSLTSRQNIW